MRDDKTEKICHENEVRLRELLDNMASGVAVYDAIEDGNDFVFKDMNKSGERLSRVDINKIRGKRLTECFPASAEIGLLDALRQVWKTGKAKRLSASYYKDERIAQWVDNYVFKLPGGEVVAIYNDTTERVNTELALRKSEERFLQIAQNAQEMIWEVDTDGLYVYVSHAVENLLGYKIEEVVGKKRYYDFFVPEYKDAYKKKSMEIMAQKKTFSKFVNQNLRKDGSLVILETSGIPVINEKGELAGYRGTDIDVTERVHMEEDLKKNIDLYKTLVENVQLGITLIDAAHKIVMVNHAFAKMFNKEPGDFIGKDCYREFEKRTEVCPHCPGVRAMSSGSGADVVTEAVLDDGIRRKVHIHTIPLFGPQGAGSGFIEVVEDITERIKLEEEAQNRLHVLEVFYKASVEREERVLELKKKVKDLEGKLSRLKKDGP